MNNYLSAMLSCAALVSAHAESAADTTPIEPVACLRKIALDLTDAAPSEAAVAAVKSGATQPQDFVDEYLQSDAFSQIMFDEFRGAFPPTELVPDDADKEEPARIALRLVLQDLDFRELVTGEYSVNTAGEPVVQSGSAGVLTTQSYMSAYTGIENRNWAGHLLKGLAGIDLAPVSDIAPGVDATRDGLANNPACSGCHTNPLSGVDNVAFFHDCYDKSGLPIAACAPNGTTTFLGQSGATVPDLGNILAESVEFRARMIQAFHTIFWGRPIGKNEIPIYREEEKVWMDAQYNAKVLIKHIVSSESYCSW